MPKALLLLTLLIATLTSGAQNFKDRHNRYRELGYTAGHRVQGAHYNWNAEVDPAPGLYYGYGAELLWDRDGKRHGTVNIHLALHPSLDGLCPQLYLAAHYLITSPTGLVPEAGAGVSWRYLGLKASYRHYPKAAIEPDGPPPSPAPSAGFFITLSLQILHPKSE